MGSPVPGRAWLQELPGQLKPALDESERPTTCLMYTLYLVEPVGPVGQVSLGPLNLEYSGREVLYELPGGGQAPWPGLLGAARALSGVGDPSFSLSRGAGIPARRQAILAGGWLQRAFAVINEVITKMHLNWSRSGRREMQGPECARALGVTCRQDPGSFCHGSLKIPIPLPTTKTLASSSTLCWWPCLPKSRAPVLALDSRAGGTRAWQQAQSLPAPPRSTAGSSG